MKILTVVGARPQFVKASVTCRALVDVGMDQVLVHTGQHYDREMSQVFFEELGVPVPGSDLEVRSGSHAQQTATMLQRLEPVLIAAQPDWVLVFGDTNSTLAGALVAAKLGFPVAHVEAGLRSLNRGMPEEVNRIVADHLSDLLFAPTESAVANLRHDGIDEGSIHLVGDVMYDVALAFAEVAERKSDILAQFDLPSGEYVLATIHRALNTDDPVRLVAIIEGLARVAAERPVVFPAHPRTRAALDKEGIDTGPIKVIEPVGYLDMMSLERHAALVATDSGGVQKEAFFHRVPCVTLREETEWVELVDLGWNRLVPPTSSDDVYAGTVAALGTRGVDAEPYGSGDAARKIAEVLAACGS